MIGSRRILPREDRVADSRKLGGEMVAVVLGPGRQARLFERLSAVEAPAMWGRGTPPRIVGKAATRAGIGGRCVPVRSGQRLGDVGAGAEAGVDQAALLQLLQRLRIVVGPLRLDE